MEIKKYIVATHSYLAMIELDSGWNLSKYKILNKGHHYGIALPTKEYQKSFFAKNIDSELLIFDKKHFDRTSKLKLNGNLKFVHQIAYANDGLYIANTFYNSIVYQSLNKEIYHEYFFGNQRQDINHVNSIFISDNQVYVLLHNGTNHQKQKSELAILTHDFNKGFSLDSIQTLLSKGCHNCYIENNYLFYNSSSTGDFVSIDLNTRKLNKISFKGYHVKGLSVILNHFIVGVSENAERENRFKTKGYIAIIDKKSFQKVAIVDLNFSSLPHNIGNINEIRCISEHDYSQYYPMKQNIIWNSKNLGNRISYTKDVGLITKIKNAYKYRKHT